jgi:hypothetical protein
MRGTRLDPAISKRLAQSSKDPLQRTLHPATPWPAVPILAAQHPISACCDLMALMGHLARVSRTLESPPTALCECGDLPESEHTSTQQR